MSALPPDFSSALKITGLADFFADCTPSHQRAYLDWIAQAKKPETRAKNIQKAMAMIAAKRQEEETKAKKKK